MYLHHNLCILILYMHPMLKTNSNNDPRNDQVFELLYMYFPLLHISAQGACVCHLHLIMKSLCSKRYVSMYQCIRTMNVTIVTPTSLNDTRYFPDNKGCIYIMYMYKFSLFDVTRGIELCICGFDVSAHGKLSHVGIEVGDSIQCFCKYVRCYG